MSQSKAKDTKLQLRRPRESKRTHQVPDVFSGSTLSASDLHNLND